MIRKIRYALGRLAALTVMAVILLTAGCDRESDYTAPRAIRDYLVQSVWYDTVDYKYSMRTHLDSLSFKSPEDIEDLYKTFNAYVWAMHQNAEDNEAIFVLHEVAQILEADPTPSETDVKQLLRTYVRLGGSFNDIGMPGMAIDYYQKGLKISNDTAYDIQRGMIFNNLGILYAEADMYPQAITSFQAALELNKRKNSHTDLILNYMNLAKLEWMRDSLDYALVNIRNGLSLIDPVKEKDFWVPYRLLEGSVLNRQGHYEEAYPILRECEKYYLESAYPMGVVDAYTNLAEYYLFTSRNDSAIEYANRALEIAKTAGRADALFIAGKIRAHAFKALGMDHLESETYRRMEERRDSLQKAENRARIAARNKIEVATLKYGAQERSHALEWILGAGNLLFIGLFIWALRRRK